MQKNEIIRKTISNKNIENIQTKNEKQITSTIHKSNIIEKIKKHNFQNQSQIFETENFKQKTKVSKNNQTRKGSQHTM